MEEKINKEAEQGKNRDPKIKSLDRDVVRDKLIRNIEKEDNQQDD